MHEHVMRQETWASELDAWHRLGKGVPGNEDLV